MRRWYVILSVAMVALLALSGPALAARGGSPGSPLAPDAIWADGALWGTIPQGSLHYNGNDESYDRLFIFTGGEQAPVSEAAPGNPHYNGGRWLPVMVTWETTPYLLTSHADVHAAAQAGDITVGAPDTSGTFLCPLIG